MRALFLLLTLCLFASAAELDDADLDARIETLRKGDFVIKLGPAHSNYAGPVTYELRRHAFPFGTCVSAKRLSDDPDSKKYQEILGQYFNAAVAENAMKWKFMEPTPGVHNDQPGLDLYKRCTELGLTVRGHCVFWGTNQGPADWHRQLAAPDLEKTMKARAAHVLGLYKGKIAEWDLNNEMLHGDVHAKILGLKNGAAYFKWAREIAPDVQFYVNDYGVLDGGKVDAYVAQIKELLESGAQIGGIGDQSHFGGGVPPNAKVWSVLDKLGQFKLPVKITEFDVNSKDEQKQAADTRRFLKLCFAHPAVHGFMFWGFWEGQHWRPNAALWRKDWTIKPNGAAYVKLITEDWHTKGTANAEKGELRFRGFYGTYQLTVGGKTLTVTLTPDQKTAAAK